MKTFLVLCLLPALFFASASNVQAADERQPAAAAVQILNAWHEQQPEKTERTLHLVCWTPSDREFPADDSARLTRMMKHIQNFYLTEMEPLGLGARTFNLAYGKDGSLVIHRVVGANPDIAYAHFWVGVEAAGVVELEAELFLPLSAQSFPLPMQKIVLWSLADTTIRNAIPFGKVETTPTQTRLATGSGWQGGTRLGGMSLGLARQSSAGEDESCRRASDSALFPKVPTDEFRPAAHTRTTTASGETGSP